MSTKKKTGIGRSLFESTAPKTSKAPKKKREAPAEEKSPDGAMDTPTTKPATTGPGVSYERTTVILQYRQLDFLDRLSLQIRRTTRAKVKRSDLIRAMIEAVEESGIELTSVESQEDVKTALLAKLQPR